MKLQFLQLNTNNLSKLYHFYINLLEFPLLKEQEEAFSFQTGETIFEFKKGPQKAYYHFAFNIPVGQIKSASNWLEQEKKIKVLPFQGNRIVNFKAWEAKALYFYDPAGNIVEFISREPLGIKSQEVFHANSIISVSEIGLPLMDVERIVQLLEEISKVEIYSGDRRRFCAIGDPKGLFILVDQAEKDWIPNDDPAIAFPLKVHFEQKEQMFILETDSETLTITKV